MITLSNAESRDLSASIVDGIRSLSQGKELSGLAKEISDESRSVLEKFGHIPPRSRNEMVLPLGQLCRAALSTSTYSAGGALVGEDVGTEVETALRASSVCVRAGARVLTNLKSNFSLPLEKTVSSLSWYPELVSVDFTQSDGTVGAAHFSPNRAVGSQQVNLQLDAQTGGRASQFFISSLVRDIGAIVDQACLVGSGVSGQPRGITSTTGTNSIVFGAAASWTKLVGTSSFESTLLTANIPSENLRWVAHPAVKAKFKSVQRFSGGSETLWSSDSDAIGGHEAYTSTYLSSTSGLICGDFSKLVIAFFGPGEGGVRLIIDPYVKSMSDRCNLVVELLADCSLLRPESMAVAGDSCLQ